jgi:hypothetical protein
MPVDANGLAHRFGVQIFFRRRRRAVQSTYKAITHPVKESESLCKAAKLLFAAVKLVGHRPTLASSRGIC